MMKRDECFRVLARHVTDEVIVSTYSSAVDWLNLGERTLNYFSVGAMGLDSSHALGLALGRPGQAHHLPARRRQPVDESRLPRHHRRGRAEEPRAHRGPERHLRGQRRPSDPEHRGRFRRHGARGRLRPRARLFAACRISSSRPAMSSSRRGRCSRRCTWSRRSRSPTTIRTCTIRRGARRSRRRCSSDRRAAAKRAQSILQRCARRSRALPTPHRAQLATAVAASGTTRRYPTPSSVSRIRGWVGSTSIFCRSLRTKMRR